MNNVSIHLENVTKFYKLYNSPSDRLKEALDPFDKEYHKKHYALTNVNLTVNKGEILGIVGKNGCGKSTLLKIVSNVLTPDSGNILVRGNVSALLELGSGFNPEFTGLQNIYFYGSILGLKRNEINNLLDDILSFADIGEYINQPLKTYSSGMKARLSFSVATAIHPEILILDEVLSVGDTIFRKKSSARMKEMMNSGCTVLLVSHSEDSINRLCTRALYLRDGEVVISGTPKNVTKLYLKTSGSKTPITNNEIRDEFKAIETSDKKRILDINHDQTEEATYFDEAFFSDEVQEQSQPVILKNFPVELLTTDIYNSKDTKVNVLEYGCSYTLVLKYHFHKSVKNIVLPMQIYTENGQLLTGVRNPGNGDRLDIPRGTELELTYEFDCNLLRGMYYISVGITELVGSGEEKHFLFRADDILSFKVQDHSRKEHWGIFSSMVTKMCQSISTIK